MHGGILEWIHDTGAGHLVRNVFWIAPTLEVLHFVGMSLLVGGLCVIDLSVLRLIRGLPMDLLRKVLPWILLGFGINLITGTLLFAAAPYAFAFNIAFRAKLLFIVLAGVNALGFWRLARVHSAGLIGFHHSGAAKALSALSVLLWLSVIACARLIPFAPG